MTPRLNPRFFPLAALFLAACAPMVTHGPRVDPGFHATSTLGFPVGGCDSSCSQLIGRIGGGVRHGWVPDDPAKPAFLAGLAVPGFDVVSPELDLYAQGPGRDRALAYGAGVLAAPRHLMPYVQAGRDVLRGTAVYATLGYARLSHSPQLWSGLPDDPAYRPPRYWQPSLHARAPIGDGAAAELFVAGAFGHYGAQVFDPGTDTPRTERRDLRMILLGLNLQWDPARRPLIPRLPPRLPPRRLPPFPLDASGRASAGVHAGSPAPLARDSAALPSPG
jgi:hypothetical protein